MPVLGSVQSAEWREFLTGEPMDPIKDLAAYLAGEFRFGEPFQMVGHRDDTTGRQLSDRMVSRLEVLSALRRLPYRQRRVIELLYAEDATAEQAAERLGVHFTTLYADRRAALAAMAAIIYESAETGRSN